ncbi:hypothetical protein KEJ18_07400 [Candidatus Bathyarchaeota archaeon]|nr:hypothetical protein [Candidatus Bathyarchaeota archaeon]
MNKDESEEANPPTLQRLFKDSAIAKLIDFLTLYRDFDYSKVEISRNSGVSWKTMYRLWPLLEKYNLIVKTRQVGRATLYKLNTDNPIASALHDLTLQISVFDAEKIAKEELNNQKETVEVAVAPPT